MQRDPGGLTQAQFDATSWTVVKQAAEGTDVGTKALAILCEQYWPPVYAYIRRTGRSQDEATDSTQSFFEHLLMRGLVSRARQERGRFRNFLLGAVRNFIANERTHERAQKRGGGAPLLSLDDRLVGRAESDLCAHHDTPDVEFERAWMRVLLTRAFARLREYYALHGKLSVFDRLAPLVTGEGPTASYAEIAKQLKSTLSSVKTASHRLRLRFGEELRREIGRTVLTETEIDEELRRFHQVFATRVS